MRFVYRFSFVFGSRTLTKSWLIVGSFASELQPDFHDSPSMFLAMSVAIQYMHRVAESSKSREGHIRLSNVRK